MLRAVRTFALIAVSGAAVVVALLGLLWLTQRSLIYLPGGAVPPVEGVLPGAREVVLRTDDGLELGAWHLPAAEGEATVLLAPGNAGTREHRVPLAEALGAHGIGILLMDYRGYGGNPGSPSEDGLARDVRAAHRYLVEEADIAAAGLVYVGESIGSAVVAELAVEHPPAGLVLRSPFTSLADVGRRHYPFLPVRLLLRDRFDVAAHVARITVPTVVVLGTADRIVPPEQSRAVAAAAAGEVDVVEVEGVDHNDRALLDGEALVTAIAELARDR